MKTHEYQIAIINLQELLKDKKVIPVIGSGVSTATADIKNWKRLIKSGLEYASGTGCCKEEDEEYREASGLYEAGDLLAAAQKVKRFLNAPGGEYANWLDQEFDTKNKTKKCCCWTQLPIYSAL